MFKYVGSLEYTVYLKMIKAKNCLDFWEKKRHFKILRKLYLNREVLMLTFHFNKLKF